MLRSYKIGSRRVDTFAGGNIFCLARSCRVVEKFDKNHRFFMISAIGSREASDRIRFLRNAVRSRQTEKALSRNVLNFMIARLQRLGPSERRAVPVQRSDFVEKLCFFWLSGAKNDHHSSLRHAQELQNWKHIYRYSCCDLVSPFGSIVSRR